MRARNFLILFFLTYVLVAGAINLMYGPPGMSDEFLDAYKPQYDRYLEITKSDAYIRWKQQPDLNAPDDVETERIAFVKEFESTRAFQAELRRRSTYDLSLDVFRALMVVLLVVWFGKMPLANFLERRVSGVRTEIENAEAARADAEGRKREAEEKFAQLDAERTAVKQEIETRIQREREAIEADTFASLALIERELEDRTRQEELAAQHALKAQLLGESIRVLVESYDAKNHAEYEAQLVDDFAKRLERLTPL